MTHPPAGTPHPLIRAVKELYRLIVGPSPHGHSRRTWVWSQSHALLSKAASTGPTKQTAGFSVLDPLGVTYIASCGSSAAARLQAASHGKWLRMRLQLFSDGKNSGTQRRPRSPQTELQSSPELPAAIWMPSGSGVVCGSVTCKRFCNLGIRHTFCVSVN